MTEIDHVRESRVNEFIRDSLESSFLLGRTLANLTKLSH
jgi:hypothetical protein